MEIKVETIINAPLVDVFRVFTDFRHLEKHVSAITKIELLEKNGEAVVGMKWRETRIMFGKEASETMWITEITPNDSYVVEAESHGMKYRSTYTFTEQDDGVLVSFIFAGEPQTLSAKIMSIVFAFFKRATVKALQKDMGELKDLLEKREN